MSTEQRTPLYDQHVALGAKMTPFAGWVMPLSYSGVVAEHVAVRTGCGMFDVSHMGEIALRGVDAVAFAQQVTCNDVSKLRPGRAQYSAVLNEQGGVVDDVIVYFHNEQHLTICVNAANTAKVVAWLHRVQEQAAQYNVVIEDQSSQWAQIAVQGPKSREVLAQLGVSLEGRRAFDHFEITFDGCSLWVAMTGYTGEAGVEIFCAPADSVAIWQKLSQLGVTPCGLGARDTLRLEAALSLYGHELDDVHSPLESGIGWVVKPAKGDFIGKSQLPPQPQRNIVGLELLDPGVARQGDRCVDGQGNDIGVVTSGTKPPTVGKAIALVRIALPTPAEIAIMVRGKPLRATLRLLPFYKSKTV